MSTWHKLGTSCVCVFVCVCVCDMLMWSLAHAEQLLFSCVLWRMIVVVTSCHGVILPWCHTVICPVLMLITGTCWSSFVFMSMLKSHSLWLFVMLSYVKCLCWSLGHDEQLLFSCLCSKVTVYDCLSCCHVMLACWHVMLSYHAVISYCHVSYA